VTLDISCLNIRNNKERPFWTGLDAEQEEGVQIFPVVLVKGILNKQLMLKQHIDELTGAAHLTALI